MLVPKRVKYRKAQRGRMKGKAQRGATRGLRRVRAEGAGAGLDHQPPDRGGAGGAGPQIKRGGKIFIRIFPDKPVTKKPAETRMGKGKGNPEFWVAVVKPGRILFEIEGISQDLAKKALALASAKLPVRTRFVKREEV